MRLLLSLLLFFPSAIAAQEINHVSADLTGDGVLDRAILALDTEGGGADLLIYVPNSDGQFSLHTKAKSLIWVGPGGRGPRLTVSPHGSLLIHSINDSIGRDRWRQTLTVAWRSNAFVLAGFTYYWYDTQDPEKSGTCDVNLLSGKGMRTRGTFLREISFRTKSRSVPIDMWDQEPPSECFPDN